MLRLLLLIPILGALSGCFEDRYRYPCHDPENWSKPVCQKPECAISRSCPEQILTPETQKFLPSMSTGTEVLNYAPAKEITKADTTKKGKGNK